MKYKIYILGFIFGIIAWMVLWFSGNRDMQFWFFSNGWILYFIVIGFVYKAWKFVISSSCAYILCQIIYYYVVKG